MNFSPVFVSQGSGTKSVMIVWNEERNDVDKYYIYIYKKNDINLTNPTDGTKPRQKTPLTIKTITKSFERVGNNSHVITGLTNGETYSITVNKISKHVEPQEIKASNTIKAVPSSVKLVDFSKLNKERSFPRACSTASSPSSSSRAKEYNKSGIFESV